MEAARGPVARAAAQVRERARAVSTPLVQKVVDAVADAVKPAYEGVERAFEAVEPGAGVTHANVEDTPPRRKGQHPHPPPPPL